MAERLTFTVPEELAGERLDKVVAVLSDSSRAVARRFVDEGQVTVDGAVVIEGKTRLDAGQALEVPKELPPESLAPEPVEFTVVFEDEHLMVVDKPAGLVVHPGAGRTEGTLAGGILHRHPRVAGIGQEGRWGIVHRLDRDTSGLLVVGLSQAGYRGLVAQVAERTMGREYLALVDGDFPVPTGTIEAPISRDPDRPTRRRVDPAGRPAVTHYQVERDFTRGFTLLRVRLETGRTHQVRVHLAAIDHPLVGDPVYRPGPDRIAVPRIFLHATRLSFTHPVTRGEMTFESPLPSDLLSVLERLPDRD